MHLPRESKEGEVRRLIIAGAWILFLMYYVLIR